MSCRRLLDHLKRFGHVVLVGVQPDAKGSLVTGKVWFFDPVFDDASFVVQKAFDFDSADVFNSVLM